MQHGCFVPANNEQEDHELFLNVSAAHILEETTPAAQSTELFELVEFRARLLKQASLITSHKLFYPGSARESGRTAKGFSEVLARVFCNSSMLKVIA